MGALADYIGEPKELKGPCEVLSNLEFKQRKDNALTKKHDGDVVDTKDQGPSAGARVFGIFELAEDILLKLPQKDILLDQRVNKTFRDTVQNSRRLRQVLFLDPPTEPLAGKGSFVWSENERFGRFKKVGSHVWLNSLLLCPSKHLSKIDIPLAFERANYPTRNGKSRVYLQCSYATRTSKCISPSTVAKIDEHGSWRKMYAAHSPVTFRFVKSRTFFEGTTYSGEYGSMTTGELLDTFLEDAVTEVERMSKSQWVASLVHQGLRPKIEHVGSHRYREPLGLKPRRREE